MRVTPPPVPVVAPGAPVAPATAARAEPIRAARSAAAAGDLEGAVAALARRDPVARGSSPDIVLGSTALLAGAVTRAVGSLRDATDAIVRGTASPRAPRATPTTAATRPAATTAATRPAATTRALAPAAPTPLEQAVHDLVDRLEQASAPLAGRDLAHGRAVRPGAGSAVEPVALGGPAAPPRLAAALASPPEPPAGPGHVHW